jgi:hypothetical protein
MRRSDPHIHATITAFLVDLAATLEQSPVSSHHALARRVKTAACATLHYEETERIARRERLRARQNKRYISPAMKAEVAARLRLPEWHEPESSAEGSPM